MATPFEALVTLLTGDVDVLALVDTRIAPVRNKQRSGFPAIAYEEIGASNPLSLGGPLNPCSTTLRLDCWSNTSEAQATAVADAVKGIAHGYRGIQAGVFLQKVSVRDSSDNPADPLHGDDVGLFCKSLEVVIVYKG